MKNKEQVFNFANQFATDDYQKRNGNYPKSNMPDTINVNQNDVGVAMYFSFKNTDETTAKRWVERKYVSQIQSKFPDVKSLVTAQQSGDYQDDWIDVTFIMK